MQHASFIKNCTKSVKVNGRITLCRPGVVLTCSAATHIWPIKQSIAASLAAEPDFVSSAHEIMVLHYVMKCKTFTATSINKINSVIIGRLPRSFRSFFDYCLHCHGHYCVAGMTYLMQVWGYKSLHRPPMSTTHPL